MGSGVVGMLCGALATLAIEDPQLESVRDEIEGPQDDEERDGDLAELVGGLGDAITTIDSLADGRWALPAFASHPYIAGRRAGLTVPDEPAAASAAARRTPDIAVRVALDGAWQYRGLWRGRFAVELDSESRIGGGLQLHLWGNPGSNDHMLLASARLHGILGNWRQAIVRTGPSVDVLGSWAPGKLLVALGVDWGLSADVFPVRPLVLSFDGRVGIIGRSLFLGGRATLGLIVRRFEFFGGYEHQQIGRAGVGGPIFGMRVWF